MEGKKISYYSQFSEDAIIDGLFRKIGTTNKFLVDIGASDGLRFSNSRFFMQQGWSGIFVEPDEESYEDLLNLYPHTRCRNYPINSKETIDFVLKAFNFPKVFDLLDIDIDGQDFYVWSDMVEYRARIVVIEWSPYVGNHFVPERDSYGKLGTNQAGLIPMTQLARHKDYNVVAITPVNIICVDNEILPLDYWEGRFPIR